MAGENPGAAAPMVDVYPKLPARRAPEHAPDLRAVLLPLAQLLAPILRELDGVSERDRGDLVRHDQTPLGKRRTLAAIHSGELPASKDGRRFWIRRADLEAFLAARRVEPRRPSQDAGERGDDLAAMTAAAARGGRKARP